MFVYPPGVRPSPSDPASEWDTVPSSQAGTQGGHSQLLLLLVERKHCPGLKHTKRYQGCVLTWLPALGSPEGEGEAEEAGDMWGPRHCGILGTRLVGVHHLFLMPGTVSGTF